jgi:protein-S-isoprenylcysteine O-methyltransferase Ste14
VARPVRHPIYTGMLAIVMATVIPRGAHRGILRLNLISISLWIKSSHEEGANNASEIIPETGNAQTMCAE